jgi:hypothetical protein
VRRCGFAVTTIPLPRLRGRAGVGEHLAPTSELFTSSRLLRSRSRHPLPRSGGGGAEGDGGGYSGTALGIERTGRRLNEAHPFPPGRGDHA